MTRDRSGEYREAITQALPEAVKIADRWHLLKNLRQAVERHLSRHYQAVRQLVADAAEVDAEQVNLDLSTKRRRRRL